jgi:hypothetical protein
MKTQQRPRLTLEEYRRKHADVLRTFSFSGGNASATTRKTGISPSRVAQITRRAGIRRVVLIEGFRSGDLIDLA